MHQSSALMRFNLGIQPIRLGQVLCQTCPSFPTPSHGKAFAHNSSVQSSRFPLIVFPNRVGTFLPKISLIRAGVLKIQALSRNSPQPILSRCFCRISFLSLSSRTSGLTPLKWTIYSFPHRGLPNPLFLLERHWDLLHNLAFPHLSQNIDKISQEQILSLSTVGRVATS